nr:NAD-dependent epimerase/dehydratase family protein [Pacificibacter marinus]
MTQNVLVTGGAGYIGSHACKKLRAADIRLTRFLCRDWSCRGSRI